MAGSQLVHDIEAARDSLRRIDDDGGHRHLPSELEKLVPVRFMVAVETPDTTQGSRAPRRLRLHQSVNQRAVDRQALMVGRLGGVHHQLLPQVASLVIGRRQLLWAAQQLAVAFAQPHPFDGQQRVGHEAGEVDSGGRHLRNRTDGNDHQWNIDVAAEEARPETFAVCRAVDTEKHCGSGESVPIQQFANGIAGSGSVDPHLTADVDGELGGIAVVVFQLAQRVGAAVPGDQPGAFQRHQAAVGYRCHMVDQTPDLRRDVDGDNGDRRILGQAQRSVAAQLVLGSKARGTAHHHARCDAVLAEQIQHRVGQKPLGADRALPLAEVSGQLQALFAHICSAIHWPSSAAAKPSMTLTAILANATRSWRSSLSRWVSSIQVEKVVYAPTNAVPASSATSLGNVRPPRNPSNAAPLMFTTSVP
ncbi:hypothetical protein BZL29_0845 [Mycobacterium kansasii]|uniref:Uncharacterized protein n=1 Tax=Mycobacterium kansasii TaxID=1768 RepID=A0A1V3Y1F8_MYCKA|nr:hypothetical protein BZL29_0845 [Mycobacterium kansasii]